jgi:predicted nucleotide-binding protein
MREGRGDEEAEVARIRAVTAAGADYLVSLTWLPTSRPILNADLFRIRDQLDVDQFEFNRHHWAIKDRDVLRVLATVGIDVDVGAKSARDQLPLPGPNRARLIEARTVIGNWGHTEIDDLLLEAGVEGLAAPRGVGNRRDRANAIVMFVLEHPAAVTADNSLFSAYLVRWAFPDEALTSDSQHAVETVLQPPTARRRDDASARLVAPQHPNRVFIVHGRNDTARDEVVEFLKSVALTPIVLHEQPNMGRHLLTKFIEEAELVTFGLILMTGDDVGGLSADTLRPRARQNVILELGYFLSHLGQPRVCALVAPGLETPSDFDGIVFISMHNDGRWKDELLRELRAAQMPVRA